MQQHRRARPPAGGALAAQAERVRVPVRLQTRLLIHAAERVKPGGAVVYSTCSIEPDENEGVVKAVLRGMRGLKLEAEHDSDPGPAVRRRLLGAVAENRDTLVSFNLHPPAGPVS